MSMTDPITATVAAAVAGKLAESLSDGAKESVAAITRRIRRKFGQQPAALAALEAAHDDPARLQDLAGFLEEAMTRDPEFGRQIRMLWQQTGIDPPRGDVVNIFHGNAENSIQVRDVHGDINIR